MPKAKFFSLTQDQVNELQSEIDKMDGDGWRVVGSGELPKAIPSGLAAKIDSAVIVVSGSLGNAAYAVWNNARIDAPHGEIDEHPFAVFILSGSVQSSGVLIDHGNWDGRTTPMSAAITGHISMSGIGDYFLGHPPQGKYSGSLDELSDSDKGAFEYCVQTLQEELG